MTSWEKGRGNSCAKPFGPDELEGLVWMGQCGGERRHGRETRAGKLCVQSALSWPTGSSQCQNEFVLIY